MWGLQMIFASAVSLNRDGYLGFNVARREVNNGGFFKETTARCCIVPDKMKTMGAILDAAVSLNRDGLKSTTLYYLQ